MAEEKDFDQIQLVGLSLTTKTTPSKLAGVLVFSGKFPDAVAKLNGAGPNGVPNAFRNILLTKFHLDSDNFDNGPSGTNTVLFSLTVNPDSHLDVQTFKELWTNGDFETAMRIVLGLPNNSPNPLLDFDIYLSYDSARSAAVALKKSKILVVFLKDLEIHKMQSRELGSREGFIEFTFGNGTPVVLGFKANKAGIVPGTGDVRLVSPGKFKNVILYNGPNEPTPVKIRVIESDDGFREKLKGAGGVLKFFGGIIGAGSSTATAVPNAYAQAAAAALALGSAAVTIAGGAVQMLSAFVDNDVEFQALTGIGPHEEEPEVVLKKYTAHHQHEPAIKIQLQTAIIHQDSAPMHSVTIIVKEAVFHHHTFGKSSHSQLRVTWRAGIGASAKVSECIQRLRSGVGTKDFLEVALQMKDYPLYFGAVKTDAIPVSFSISCESTGDFKAQVESVTSFLSDSGKQVSDAVSFAYKNYNNIRTYEIQQKLDAVNARKTALTRKSAGLTNQNTDIQAKIKTLDPVADADQIAQLTKHSTNLNVQIEQLNRELTQDLTWHGEDLTNALAHVTQGQVLGPLASGYSAADPQIRAAGLLGVQSLEQIALQTAKETKSDVDYSMLVPFTQPEQHYYFHIKKDTHHGYECLPSDTRDEAAAHHSFIHILVKYK